jgi:endonuclease/exonuclease/phosphatase family metal-dependent hydrolase
MSGRDDDDDEDRRRGLSMMTYNVHHAQRAGDRLDLDRIAEVIRSQEVQVVGLQEVDRHWSERSEFVDQAPRRSTCTWSTGRTSTRIR